MSKGLAQVTEPTERTDVRIVREATRDPFAAISDDAARIRQRVVAAIEAIVGPKAHLKITNIVIDAGKVAGEAIVIEVRHRPAKAR